MSRLDNVAGRMSCTRVPWPSVSMESLQVSRERKYRGYGVEVETYTPNITTDLETAEGGIQKNLRAPRSS